VLGLPLLVACGPNEEETVSGQAFAVTAEQNVESALRGLYDAGSFVADSASLAEILGPFVAGTSDCDVAAPACPPGAVCSPPVDSGCETPTVTVEDLKENRQEVSDAIDDLVEVLREKIFTPGNLESEDASSATYLIGAATLCENSGDDAVTPGGAAPAPGAGALDPECVDEAARLQIRLRLTQPSPGDIDVQLLMTAARHNPATLELHDDHVGLAVDLGQVKATLDTLGEDTMQLTELSGVVALELVRNAELDYSLRYSMREDIQVGAIDDEGRPIDVTVAASIPAGELRLDGNARTLTGTYNLGSVHVVAPLASFIDEEPSVGSINGDPAAIPPPRVYTGTIDAFLSGLDGSVTLDGNMDRIALKNLGVGDTSSTIKHDGNLIAQLDVNPDAGRHFDLLAQKADDGRVQLTVSPNLDLRVLLNFASLAGQLDDLPAYALGDSLRLFFDGTDPTIKEEADALRVVSGTLNLMSETVPTANVIVPAGSCLVETDLTTPAEHELLSQFAAAACP
jgi:hypothetical protein